MREGNWEGGGRSMAYSQFEMEPNINAVAFHLKPNPGLHLSNYHDLPHFLMGREC